MSNRAISIVSGVALILAASASAFAADMAVKMPVKAPAPAPVPVFSWTGCYLGGNVGGLWAHKDWTVAPGDPFFTAGAAFGSHDADGWLGGVQGGCNYQFAGGFAVGVQGDYDWTNAKGSNIDQLNFVFHPGDVSDRTGIRSLTSVTGRIGYSWDRFLGYVKGGGAWERADYLIFANAVPPTGLASETRSGWTVGIGGEYAFTNWITAFIEYDYYGFGTRTNTFEAGNSPPGIPFDNVNVKEHNNVLKVGVNFLWGPR